MQKIIEKRSVKSYKSKLAQKYIMPVIKDMLYKNLSYNRPSKKLVFTSLQNLPLTIVEKKSVL